MGWLSKILGIDSRGHKAEDARRAQKAADDAAAAARKQAEEVQKQTQDQNANFNTQLLEIQRQGLKAAGDNQALEAARQAKAQEQAAATAAEAQKAGNYTQNARADLRSDTVANVIAGGTAEVATVESLKRKKPVVGGVAAALGINI